MAAWTIASFAKDSSEEVKFTMNEIHFVEMEKIGQKLPRCASWNFLKTETVNYQTVPRKNTDRFLYVQLASFKHFFGNF